MLDKIVRTSIKNIPVYKVFVMNSLNSEPVSGEIAVRTILRTPVMCAAVDPDGDLIIAEKFRIDGTFVYEGVHAFTKRRAANKLAKRLSDQSRSYEDSRFRVVPCVVPAHTPYIIGVNDQIASLIVAVPPIRKKRG